MAAVKEHCRHCIPECASTDEWHIRETGTPDVSVLTTGCTACGEAKRIADAVAALPAVSTYRIHGQPVYRTMTPAEVANKIRGGL